MVVGVGAEAARTAIEEAAEEPVEADWEKLMFRSTGVEEEAACMVYLAISKLHVMALRWRRGVMTGLDDAEEKGGKEKT